MKNKFSLPVILLFGILSGQVGINTTEPKTTFDVAASPLSNQKADGVLIPKLSGDDLRAKNNLYEAPQHGALLYITSADSQPAGKTENVTAPGFYFYDASLQKWTSLNNSSSGNITGSWFVQNTTNPATANTENIYQQGKVAVGFSNTDAVSGKQLEVKGDFKIKGSNGGTYSFLETNGTSFFTGQPANLMYSANNPVFNQATHASGIVSQPELFAAFKSNPSGIDSSSMTLQQNSFNIGTMKSGTGSNYQFSNVSGDANQIVLAYQRNKDGGGIQTVRQIRMHENLGIDFSFLNNQDGVPFSHEGYYFPQNKGSIGQVLTVDAMDSSNTRSLLAWKDAPQLWKIQHTQNPAALNTDNIYQQGKVAIGFDQDDAESIHQLDVKGSLQSVYSVDGTGINDGLKFGSVITTKIPNGGSNYLPALAMQTGTINDFYGITSYPQNKSGIVAVNSWLNLLSDHTESSSSGRNYSQLEMFSDKNNSSYTLTSAQSGYATSYLRGRPGFLKLESGGTILGYGGELSLHTDETMLSNVNSLGSSHIRIKGNDISFRSSNGEYTFPNTAGTANQVLGTNAGNPSQLEWKNLPTGINNWRIQNTTNPATDNTDDIYQIGTVAIGKNSVYEDVNNKKTVLEVLGAVTLGGERWETIGANSAVIGSYAGEASGENSVTVGGGRAKGNNTIALAGGTAEGQYAMAWGMQANAMEQFSLALGMANVAEGTHSTVIGGYSNYTKGGFSFVTGQSNRIDEYGTHSAVFGTNNTVNAAGSAVFGDSNEVEENASYSTVFGFGNKASGRYSMAANGNNVASGQLSAVFGQGNFAVHSSETVLGAYNAVSVTADATYTPFSGNGKTLFQIGNGANASNRRNAMTVTQSGRLGIGITGTEAAALPTETFDVGSGNVKIRDINSNAGITTDKIVVADTDGVLRTIERSQIMKNIPEYANDVAADADNTLPSGALYKVTGSRAVYQKP